MVKTIVPHKLPVCLVANLKIAISLGVNNAHKRFVVFDSAGKTGWFQYSDGYDRRSVAIVRPHSNYFASGLSCPLMTL